MGLLQECFSHFFNLFMRSLKKSAPLRFLIYLLARVDFLSWKIKENENKKQKTEG